MDNITKNTKLPSDIKTFKKVINISLKLLEEVDLQMFLSPYSTVPVISQLLGLNTPLMGSGHSPYSIISIIFQLQNKEQLFRDMFGLPLIEKRRIIDEIYEMIAPFLLGEEDNYIELLINTKYNKNLRDSNRKVKEFTKIFKEKFATLHLLIHKVHNRNRNRNGNFGHLVHYGYPEDLYREYDFLKRLPISLAEEWRNYSYPIVNEMMLDNFPTYKSDTQKKIKGWVLFITNYTKELLENGKLRKRKILQAAKLAEKLGAKIIGMGGLIASFAQGGYWLSQQIPHVGFTTGHAYTIGNIMEMMEKCTKKVGLNIKKSTISIVGAAGSIGSGCAKLLANKGPKEVILIDLSTFSAQEKLEGIIKYMKNVNPYINVRFSDSFADLKKADIIIAATNSPTSLISSKHLKRGAIVIDDSFPKNVSQEVLNERKDIILLEGGITQLPFSIEIFSGRNMPDLMDVPLTRVMSCKETYGCVAETLVLALYGYERNYGLGHSDLQLAKDIMKKAKQVGFASAPLQCYDEAVASKRFERVRKIIGCNR